jgi:RAVE protein 1 C terminal
MPLSDVTCRYPSRVLNLTANKGQYCLALYRDVLELWCSRASPAQKVHSLKVDAVGKFLCFLQLPRATHDGEVRKFLAITDSKESFAWCVDFSKIYQVDVAARENLNIELLRHGPFPTEDDIHLISAVDPMGWRATINSESLDVYTRELLVTVSDCGRLQTWTTNLSQTSHSLNWLNLSTVPTNISNPSLVHGTSERKVAMGIGF